MDYFFGDGVGEPTHWQGEPDLTLGTGAADALWVDFNGNGYAHDALWDSDGDGIADRVVTDVGTAVQAVYADDGRGVWNSLVGGAGALAAGSAGAGSVSAGSVGTGSAGVGSVGAGSVGAGSVGAGSVGAGALVAGIDGVGAAVEGALAAGSEALGSLPDWGSLLDEAVGALEAGSAEAARWTAPPVAEPDPVPPPTYPEKPGPVQGGTAPEPAPPVVEDDGSISVDTDDGWLSLADLNGDGLLDAALPFEPPHIDLGSAHGAANGSVDVGVIDAEAVGIGSAAAGSAAAGSAAAGSAGAGSAAGGSAGAGSISSGSLGAGSVGAGSAGGGSVAGGSVAGGSVAGGSLGAGSVGSGS